MNKLKYIIGIIAIISLSACSEEEWFKKRNRGEVTVEAGFANTRTTFTEDNGVTHVSWEVGDAIGLTTNRQMGLEYMALAEGSFTRFEAVKESLNAQEGDVVYAYYPYSYQTNLNHISIPDLSRQKYEDTSDYDFIFASGKISNNKLSLQFKHLFSFLKITIPIKLIGDKGLHIHSTEQICSGYFDAEKEEVILEKIDSDKYYSPIYNIYYEIATDDIINNNELTCYIAFFPQQEGTEIKICKWDNNGIGDCLITKTVPVGGFKAGNIYTLYLDENGQENIRSQQKDALISFYKATNGNNWLNKTNWCSDKPIDEWYGVYLSYDDEYTTTISLRLGNNNLSGQIPEEIGNIPYLKSLELSFNNLSGNIPTSIGNLSTLSYLSLQNNQLSGEIPESIGNLVTLKNLILSHNQFSGSIPTWLDKLVNLEVLELSCNRFTGSIPNCIGNMTHLTSIYLGNNNLSGSIPPEIGNLTSLKSFSIGHATVGASGGEVGGDDINPIVINRISGSIPAEISNLKKLEVFDVGSNRLTGEIPIGIWDIPTLTTFQAEGNLLSGQISTNICNAKHLQTLWLGNNLLTGLIPEELWELTGLESLDIGNSSILQDGKPAQEFNHFEGKISENIRKMVNLRELKVANVGLTGEIPLEICQLSQLEVLILGNSSCPIYNTFSGGIPIDIGNLNKLTYLDFSSAGLSGEIPNSLYQLSSLRTLYLGNDSYCEFPNVLGGKISEAIGNLKNLADLNLMNNNIEGSIPEALANLTSLHHLVLCGNRLSGLIPQGLIQSPNWNSWNPEVWILPQQKGYTLYVDSYVSTDFSKDGEVITLQKHSVGNGIKLVLMGDAFVDADMGNGGVYETMMKKAMEAYFSVEPFKSLRAYYDVVCIKAVSKNNQIGEETVFETRYGVDTYIEGNNEKVMEYAAKAFSTNSVDDIQVIMVLNDSKYAGTCHMYSNGFSVAYCPYVDWNEQTFREMLHHEACGHGFAFLADEYTYGGTIPESEIAEQQEYYDLYGWNANVDFTSDLTRIKWSHFVTDERYADENIGAYEGGLTYDYGVYRPTESSIMQYNVGQFNAPSREAIYKRAMKLAYGNSWTYDYETFVEFDRPSRTTTRAIWNIGRPKDFVPLAPPVVHNYPAIAK